MSVRRGRDETFGGDPNKHISDQQIYENVQK